MVCTDESMNYVEGLMFSLSDLISKISIRPIHARSRPSTWRIVTTYRGILFRSPMFEGFTHGMNLFNILLCRGNVSLQGLHDLTVLMDFRTTHYSL